eukprot:9807049-Heterocapsa_arctica.AAC.1
MRHAPVAIRQFLRMHPEDVMSSYVKLKGALESYHVRGALYALGDRSQWDEMDASAVPMDVGEVGDVEAIAKGKGKGKGKKA